MNPEDFNDPNNEMSAEIGAIQSLNSFFTENAPARCVMFGASHFPQHLVIEGSEPKINLSGVEEEMGKYTLSVKMPEDGTIIAMIPKFTPSPENGIQSNPETLVIYRGHESNRYGCFTVPYYCSHDPVFGFKYEIKPAFRRLSPGNSIPKGVVFADSPAVKGESHYTYSRNLNIAVMSHPNVGLDGYVISRDVLPHFKFRIFEKRVVEFGNSSFLLNLYGDNTRYKAFPDIGEYIRESGLVVASRRYDPLMAPALTSVRDLQRVDYQFDRPVFARPGQGRVVDITVTKNDNLRRMMPEAMVAQLEHYHQAGLQFYAELLKFEKTEMTKLYRGGQQGSLPLTEDLQNLLVYARGVLLQPSRVRPTPTASGKSKPAVNPEVYLAYKNNITDLYRVELTIEYILTPTTGFKFTCENGGKGVACRIESPENMPVDADGNRADIITGPDSIPSRMNLGRMYSPYFAAAARDVRRELLEIIGYDRHWQGVMTIETLKEIEQSRFIQMVDHLTKYYYITSPRTYKEFTELLTEEERYQWLTTVFTQIYNYFPVDNMRPLETIVNEIEQNFKLTYGPVTYVGHGGVKVTTKNKIRIAPIPIMLLDKIADGWLAASTGKHSNFGILTGRVQGDKYTRPWRCTTPRVVSETEGRIYGPHGSRLLIAEMLDRNGNPIVQHEMARNIIHAKSPANIPKLVDRKKYKFGNTRPLQIVNQFFYCMGTRMAYFPEQPLPENKGD